MNIRLNRYLFGVLLMMSGLPVVAQNTDTLRLSEAIQMGLEKNYSIQIATNNKNIADNNYTLGNAGFLPTLDAIASQNYEVQDSRQLFDREINPEQIVNGARSNSFSASALLEWTVFDGTRMFITYDKLAELQQASAIEAQINIENTVADISAAYYSVILEQARVNVLQNSVDLSRERLRLARTKYEVGNTSRLEYLAAQVDYNADTSALIQQKEQLYNTKVDLNTFLIREPDTDFAVPNQIDANMDLSIGELREKALSSNPNLLLVRRNQHISYLEMRELEAERWPEILVNLGYGYNTSVRQAGFVLESRANGVNYGVAARLNIFNGFNKNRQIQNARILTENRELELKDVTQQLRADLEKIFTNYTNSIILLDLESENLEIARENARIALERYRLGNSNALELREAQINAVQAESRLIDAIYSTKIAEIELLRLSGQMVSSQ